MGEIQGADAALPSSGTPDHGPDLGCIAMSHANGGAGWWQSPSPDLERGPVGKPLSLLHLGQGDREGENIQ